MEELVVQDEALAIARHNMEDYFNTHDIKYVAEDAVFVHMNTGEEIKGREAIGNLLHYMYHVAFDARAVITSNIITETNAVLEAYFEGKHIGEFAGLPATQKDVRVPICITYELENGLIKSARVYILMDIMMKQLTGK